MSHLLPRTPRAVVFDMDGVLVDSEPLWHEAEIEAYARHGVTLTAADCQETTGVRVDGVARHWRARYPHELANVDDQIVITAIVDGVVDRVRARGAAMPGALAAIAHVKAVGLPIGLASSSPPAIIDAVLHRLGIRQLFNDVRSAFDLAEGKPNPQIYLDACRALAVDPADAVAVEDSDSGLRAALAAGMMVVAVPDPASATPPSAARAHVQLADLRAFPALFETD